MGLVDYQKVEYRDVDGTLLSFAEFQKKLPNLSFAMEKRKNGEQSSAIVKLQSLKTKATPLPKPKLTAGSAFPAFKLRASDDTVIDNASLHGRYTVLSFYFADCAPCIQEVPMLNEFAARNKEFGALAITFDSVQETKKFADRTGLSWRTLPGADELIKQVGVKAYPTIALLDPKGIVVAIDTGVEIKGEGHALDKWVQKAMASRLQ